MTDGEHVLVRELAGSVHRLELDSDAISRIGRFLDLLELWNQRLRLTGERDRDVLVRKHVVDTLACVPLLPPEGAVADIGTGAGFPGAVLACVRPDLEMTLLDARERAGSFLGEVVRAVPLPRARPVVVRAEDAAADASLAGRQHLIVSRAVRMDDFLAWACPLRAPDGIVVAMQTPRIDLAEARKRGDAVGLQVAELRDYRLPDGEPRRLVVYR